MVTLSVAVAESAAKSTVVGAGSEIVDPVSLTATVTVSAAAGSPVRVKVNSAAVPSVTGDVPAAMVTSEGGGGGWGDPLERSPDAVLDDVRQGYVSIASAREDYGVVIDPDTLQIDRTATQALRRS